MSHFGGEHNLFGRFLGSCGIFFMKEAHFFYNFLDPEIFHAYICEKSKEHYLII